ncbi:hypothetical protein CRG98_020563 [Punica granatum]|uniref:Uncharacterized protein n=1 Tax=Punica granatum TaxID=22663 RepID=A0A2I0JRR8_PUNGR|nr:hypothetical protein CRG98_020563 [Punica granatum]
MWIPKWRLIRHGGCASSYPISLPGDDSKNHITNFLWLGGQVRLVKVNFLHQVNYSSRTGLRGQGVNGGGFCSSLPLRFSEAVGSPVLHVLRVFEELGSPGSRITKALLLLVSTMTFCLISHRRRQMMESESELQVMMVL